MNCSNVLKIAVIDTQINYEYFYNDNNIEVVNPTTIEITGELSHGTVCCKLIRKFCPHAKIFNYVVLNNNKGNVKALHTALRWCIANLSLGTTYMDDAVADSHIYTELYEKEIIVLSAQSNSGYITFPASFPTVISVEENKSAATDDTCMYLGLTTQRCTNLVASGRHTIQLTNSIEYTTPGSNSYATAFATAYIAANLLGFNGNIEKVMSHFSIDSLPFTFHSFLLSLDTTLYIDFELDYIDNREISDLLPMTKIVYLNYADEIYDILLQKDSNIIFLSSGATNINRADTRALGVKSLVYLNSCSLAKSFAYSSVANQFWSFVLLNSTFRKLDERYANIPVVVIASTVRQCICNIRYALRKELKEGGFVLEGYSNLAIDVCCGYNYIENVNEEKNYYANLFAYQNCDMMLNSYSFKHVR